jgi:tRNA (mo5U34)-methyltransferase
MSGVLDKQAAREAVPEPTAAERRVANLLPLGASTETARHVLEEVPFWFHTFALDGASLYTPGVAREHGYRMPWVPGDLSGLRVLDVGTFDGFYAFLAEARGAERVVAVDNEQYRAWVHARWGVDLEGGEGFRAIARLIGSHVEYRRLDAFELDELDEGFDLVMCFGILHRVESPLGLFRVLARRLAPGGDVLLETYGVGDRSLDRRGVLHVADPGEVYARDHFVYWGFTASSLDHLAHHAGFAGFESLDEPEVDGHPRIIGRLVTAE